MIDKLVQSTISSLGYLEKGVYYCEPDCFDNVRDLIRFIHGDDKELTVRRICSGRNIVKNDLVPIMRIKNISEELFDSCLRLAVNLCQPTIIALNGKYPVEKEEKQIYFEAETNLVRTISAFADIEIFNILAKRVEDFFSLEWDERTEKQKLLVERIFVLIRYVFGIGTESGRNIQVEEIDLTIKNKVICYFFESKFCYLFLNQCKDAKDKEFCLHILAILSSIFKNIDPTIIVMDSKEFELKNKQEVETELKHLIETKKQSEHVAKQCVKRSFMRGSFVAKGVKALNKENDMVLRSSTVKNNLNPIENLSQRKSSQFLRKNRRVSNLDNINRGIEPGQMSPNVINIIKDFCIQLLNEDRYNKLMKMTKDLTFATSRSLTHRYAEIYYYSLAKFMLQFVRIGKFSSAQVTSTFSVEFFYHINTYLDSNFEHMKTDKENIKNYSLKCEYAVGVYKEMLILLNSIMDAIRLDERDLFKEISKHIFEIQEFRDLGHGIMAHLKANAATEKMLQDLVIANHYYISMMEKSYKRGELEKVRTKKRPKPKTTSKRSKNGNKKMSMEELMEIWDKNAGSLSDVLMNEIEPNFDISPINNLLKVDDDQHKTFAMLKIQKALRDGLVCDAVGLYRTSRDLWPENGIFGDRGILPEDEFLQLNELFYTDLQETNATYSKAMNDCYGNNYDEMDQNVSFDERQNEELLEGQEMNEELEENIEELEENFEFDKYILKFSKQDVLSWYIYLFKSFDKNTLELNRALVKLFHRIAFDLKYPEILYLASLFCVLKQVDRIIQKWPKENRKKHKHYFIYEFGFYLLQKFFKLYGERGSALICDLLVYNTGNEIQDMEDRPARIEGRKPKAKKTKKPKITKDYQIITTDCKESPQKMEEINPNQEVNETGYYEESE